MRVVIVRLLFLIIIINHAAGKSFPCRVVFRFYSSSSVISPLQTMLVGPVRYRFVT